MSMENSGLATFFEVIFCEKLERLTILAWMLFLWGKIESAQAAGDTV